MRNKRSCSVCCVFTLAGLWLANGNVSAQVTTPVIDPAYAGSYSALDLGLTPVSGRIGGIVFKDPNTLYLAINDDTSSGTIESLTVVRGADQHIIGYSGTGTFVATAPWIDGGMMFAPNGTLLYTAYPINTLGEIKPGSTSPDKTVLLTSLGVSPSTGSLAFVPDGMPGAGQFKLTSWDANKWYEGFLTADGSGTYSVSSIGANIDLPHRTEGIGYVAAGEPLFPVNSVILAADKLEALYAYQTDSGGNPIIATAKHFADVSNAYGVTFDPVTGDMLVSTEVGVASTFMHITRIEGFAPEPGAWAFVVGGGCLAFGFVFRRFSRRQSAAV